MSLRRSLEGKSALITGSTSGIGLGLAIGFARQGANLTLNGFGDSGDIERLVSALEMEHQVKVAYSSANMLKPFEIRKMIAEHEQRHGAIDILVNNAGIQHVSAIEEFSDEKWDAIIAINLSSNFHTIKAALPKMRNQPWGRIINLASVHGVVASPFKSAYVSAKHGVLGLTKTVALELADSNITCNAICPGYVKTPLVEKQIDQQAEAHKISRDRVIREVILASQPKKEFVEIEALSDLALFLCTSAAKSVTGANFNLDGGWTAR